MSECVNSAGYLPFDWSYSRADARLGGKLGFPGLSIVAPARIRDSYDFWLSELAHGCPSKFGFARISEIPSVRGCKAARAAQILSIPERRSPMDPILPGLSSPGYLSHQFLDFWLSEVAPRSSASGMVFLLRTTACPITEQNVENDRSYQKWKFIFSILCKKEATHMLNSCRIRCQRSSEVPQRSTEVRFHRSPQWSCGGPMEVHIGSMRTSGARN